MKKELGLKTSPLLWICRIASILLFIGTVGGFFLSAIDIRTTDSLSEEYRSELMSTESFRKGTKITLMFAEDPAKYGKVDDIISIECSTVRYSVKLGGTIKTTELAYVNLDGKPDIYFNITNNFALITKNEYESITTNSLGNKFNFSFSKDSYSGVELKLIKEIATSDTVSDTIYNWDLEKISSQKSFPLVQKLLWSIKTYERIDDVTEISCICLSGPEPTAVIKIEMSSQTKPICYWVQSTDIASMTYEQYLTYYDGNEYTYSGRSLEIVLTEAGVK